MTPTTFKLDQPWQVVKEKLMENNVELTEEDLAYQPGQEDQLLERLQKKMGLEKERIKELIESISSNRGKAS
jgi:hypothetical protein